MTHRFSKDFLPQRTQRFAEGGAAGRRQQPLLSCLPLRSPRSPRLMNWLVLVLAAMVTPALANPEVPGKPQAKPIALTNAVIHPVSGEVIDRGTILFDKGKITALGKEVAIPEGAEKVDLEGKHIYPSLFDAGTDLGLVEINSVPATEDFQ